MPVLISGNNQIISNKEKAEVRTEASVKVHSNISDYMKELREKRVRDNKKCQLKTELSEGTMDAVFTLYELKQALEGVNHTSPGKEEVCYEMIKHVFQITD